MFRLKLYAVSDMLLSFFGEGYVLGVFRRGMLLKLGSAFVSILFAPELSHPLSAVIKRGALAFPVFPGMKARLEKGALYIGDNLVNLYPGVVWNPRVFTLSKFGVLKIRDVLSSVNIASVSEQIEEWCCACERKLKRESEVAFVREVLSMIGFGEGSTPLADDVIGGMMLGLFLVGDRELLLSLRKGILMNRDKTSEYSLKMMLLFSAGLVPWSLKAFLAAPCERRLRRVLSLGSSSGLGMLRGIKAVLRSVE